MKILHVIPSYEPAWAFGGPVISTSNLCRALAKKGVEVTVYTTDANGTGSYLDVPLNQPIDMDGVKVWYFHCDLLPKKAFYSRRLARKLKETVKDFDLVHVSAIWQGIQMDVYKNCIRYKIPYIIVPRSSLMSWAFYEIGNKFLKKIYWSLWGVKSIKNTNAIHFLCEGERENSKEFIYSIPSFIVPNGVNCEDFRLDVEIRANIRKQYGIPQECLLLLFLGRIHPKKNIEYILWSLEKFKNNVNNFLFLVAGPIEDEKYYSYLKTISDRRLKNNVKWLPPVGNEKVKQLYLISDIMVLPSKVEGVSMSVTEALASSLPVLISDRVANYYEIQEDKAGIVVSPTVESITEGLKKIFENPEILQKLSLNARKSAEKRYDINKVAELMIKAYEDVLTGRRSPELQWK